MRYAILFVTLAAVGCGGATYTPTLDYLVDPALHVQKAPNKTDISLGLRPLESANPGLKSMSYTEDGVTLQQYPNAQWADAPRDVVMRALSDALSMTGHFHDVGNAADMATPDWTLTGTLRKYYEDRSGKSPQAVCEISLDVRADNGAKPVYSAILKNTVPMEGDTPAEFAKAMEKAVADVAQQAAQALAAKQAP